MNYRLLLPAVALFLLSCGERNQQAPKNESDSITVVQDTTPAAPSPYFPVYDFIREEMEYVDSLPVGIKKYLLADGKVRDSAYIKLEEFHKLADQFLAPEIQYSAFAKTFKESSFFDRSTNNATFLYKATDTAASIKRIDVVTAKGDVYDEVKSIYIEKIDRNGNGLVKKLYWKPKRNFQIITLYPEEKGKQGNEVIKVVWDNRE